ncbi:dihydrofolate reductase-like domain-containing protein [Phaeosphaeriaceae sp. PMI808]|nr:dihydrofolate reductase-like domain-containing protein [Phaeosphaeriaceae sp. PMI808]
MPKPPTLTLILAATPSLGIGKNGTLPWPSLKKEMGYFARVTKRVTPGTQNINAVLMGRKTWDSIPPPFRPLKDRLNIVITRNPSAFRATLDKDAGSVLVASGVLDALAQLEARTEVCVERVFVIGGASVYRSALELPATKRVLLTKIGTEFECDVFFSVDLEESEVWGRRGGEEGWREFTGEGGESVVEEKGVRFEFCLFERE